MRKITLLCCALLCTVFSRAQVTGVKTIGVDYPTIAAAVNALNTSGVGAGGATINVPGGYAETAPAGGFVLGSTILNASLGAANPLTIQKGGAGANPLITAPVGTSTTVDGIFKVAGVDYLTIDGIDLQESAANTTATTATEWGYAFVNLNSAAPFDGCNNNTIKNCTITLNRTIATPSSAIYFSHITATSSTALTITATGDLHSNNKVYSNTITNTTTGINFTGFSAASPYTLYDQGNDIGGTSAATGNTITNFGGTNYTSIGGITFANQNNGNVSNNTLNQLANGGVNTIGAHWGIYTFGTNSAFTVNNNNITLGIASINTAYFTYGVYSNAAGTNLTVTNNTITQSDPSGSAVVNYGIFFPNGNNLTATGNTITQTQGVSGTTYGIYTTALGTLNVSNNVIKQTTTAAVTSGFASIYCSATAVAETINGNSFNNTNVNTTGTYYMIYSSNGTPNITVSGNSINGSFTKAGAGGTVYGYYNNGSPTSGTATISSNNFSNVNLTGATGFYGTFSNTSTSQVVIITGNTVSNITTGASTIFGLYHSYGAAGSLFNNNTVSGLSGASTVNGMQVGSTAALGIAVYGNSVSNLSTTGASTVTGLLYSGGTNGSVYKNNISGLTASNAAGIVNGVTIAAATTALNFYNNVIGDLKAPLTSSATDAVRGINITATTATSNLNLSYNTVNIAASSTGANFSTSALFATTSATATSASLTLRNNILINTSTPNGTGYTSAYRRSSTTLTNYNTASNNNLYYPGSGCTNNAYLYDGTTAYLTLATFKAAVGAREAASVSEISTPFVSTTGVGATFLHINTATPTVAESAGITVAGITDDIDGDVRNATTPDLGADEFAGTAPSPCAGTPAAGVITGNVNICQGSSTILTLTGYSSGSGISIQWQSSATSGGPYTNINCANGPTLNTGVIPAGTTVYYVAVVTCANGGAFATTAQFAVTSNATPAITLTPASATICNNGTGTSITASGAATYIWSPAAGLSATTGATVTANPSATTTYTVTGTSAAGCPGISTILVTVNPAPVVTGVTASSTNICSGAAVNLNATVTSNSAPLSVLSEGFEGGIPAGWAILNGGTGNNWTIGPVNGTARTGTKCAEYNWNSTNAANTYLITGGVTLTAGVTYTVSSWYRGTGTTFPEKLKVTVGTAQTIAAQTTTIQDLGTITTATYTQQSATFTPGVSGVYYFAWNCYSAANEFYLDVDDISITSPAPADSYAWTSTPAGFTSNVQNPTGVVTAVTTTYNFTITNSYSCPASGSVTVTVNNPIAYAVTGGGGYCNGGTGVNVGLANSQTGVTYQLVLNGTTNVGAPVAGTGAAISFGLQTTIGTYTVVATNTTYLCTSNMTGSVSVFNFPAVVITPTYTQPTTCVTTDGAISIALSGAPGPYSFIWTGPGVVTNAQNQTNLIAGTYTVTVTDGNGCSGNAVLTLVGPGGCSICPTIGSVTTNPTPSGCIGTPVSLTASGLTSMGITYGIEFRAFTTATANPYAGGTVLATVPNGSLTGGGTTATGTGTFAAANTYFVYAVLSPTPLDPTCRPSVVTNFTINPTPTAIATPASQTICSGTAITTIAMSGAVGSTTYNWTRDNTATVTGITANGSGDITGTLINTTTVPVTVTFTITPVAGGCSGTPITATVLVNPTPTVTATPLSQTICSGGTIATIVNGGSAVAATTYSWTRNNTATVTGIPASGTGNISGALTNTTGAPVTVTFTITPIANGCSGTPVTATVLVNPVTTAIATPASQTICSAGTLTPIVLTGVSGTTFTWTRDNTTTVVGGIPASGSGSSITGFLTNLTTAPVTVTFTITPLANGCPGTPITATVLVNPLASAVATPATQTACSGSPITTIALTSNVTGTTYSWTRDNTVAATGIAASGTGNITGTLTTTGTAAVTVTFTITPSFAGCPGPSITATVTINPTPVVTQPVNQTLCNGSTTAVVNFSGGITGTTYSWTNNTTSIGLAAGGTGNIAAFTATNTGIAPVTATITVTPSLNGCTGAPKTFTITVNPTANVNAIANQTLCTGAATTAVTFAGTVAGTTYSWTNNTPSIGLAASGTGNIASFTAINTTSTAVTATITVTPTAAGCAGTPKTFTITVNGQSVAPTGATASNIALCGAGTADLTVQGGALGTGASWKWYSGSCGGTLIGTGATITGVPVNGTATFYVRAEGTCNTTTCASVTVTVNPQPTITLSAAPYTSLMPPLVTGITANITPVSATNTIVWFKDGVLINGANINTLSGITVDQLGSYTARVTTTAGCTALSAPLVIRDSASNKLFILPNPNNGQFKIRYYTSARNFGFLRTVTIYDSKGARVFTKAIPVTAAYSTMDIDIRNAGKGLYIVVVGNSEGKELITGKVVVQ
ncbi:PKD-like domain-containing protein [Ferruginibacter profundus]